MFDQPLTPKNETSKTAWTLLNLNRSVLTLLKQMKTHEGHRLYEQHTRRQRTIYLRNNLHLLHWVHRQVSHTVSGAERRAAVDEYNPQEEGPFL